MRVRVYDSVFSAHEHNATCGRGIWGNGASELVGLPFPAFFFSQRFFYSHCSRLYSLACCVLLVSMRADKKIKIESDIKENAPVTLDHRHVGKEERKNGEGLFVDEDEFSDASSHDEQTKTTRKKKKSGKSFQSMRKSCFLFYFIVLYLFILDRMLTLVLFFD